MRVLIQRVKHASVEISGCIHSQIGPGMLVLLGIEGDDTTEDIEWLCGKISRLRIFNDSAGVMNLSLDEIGGECLIVSQFTLMASTKKGNRPSYIRAAVPEVSEPLYRQFVKYLGNLLSKPVATGVFGADMQLLLLNDGPVTIWIDSKARE